MCNRSRRLTYTTCNIVLSVVSRHIFRRMSRDLTSSHACLRFPSPHFDCPLPWRAETACLCLLALMRCQ